MQEAIQEVVQKDEFRDDSTRPVQVLGHVPVVFGSFDRCGRLFTV